MTDASGLPPRESMEYDVVGVGADLAGLSAAIRFICACRIQRFRFARIFRATENQLGFIAWREFYEVVYADETYRAEPRFVISARNWVHCKTCDTKDRRRT